MSVKKLWLLWPLLSIWALNGCVQIPNTKACSVAGKLTHGMICAETLTGATSVMTFEDSVKWLEPDPTPTLGHSAAICQSDTDWNSLKTALEQACRELGSRCSYKIQEQIKVIKLMQINNGVSSGFIDIPGVQP